jgi:flavorubredoxin
LIKSLLQKVADLGLEIDMICPDHGVIWRKNPAKIINTYAEWAEQVPAKKAVVIYDTMWKSTETMAMAIASGIAAEGVSVRPIHLRRVHRSDVMTDVLDARAVIVGSPTLNNQLFPTVSDMLTYMKGLKPKNKIAAAFGSYGWSGEAVKLINKQLDDMQFEIIDPGLRIHYVPDQDGKDACVEFGKKIGGLVKEAFD